MNAESARQEMMENRLMLLDVDPDVVVLGEYLAEKRGLSLGEFVEYLITKEAAKGKVVHL